MSDEERKKNGEYEKPESRGMGGDDLADVSGGTGGKYLEKCSSGGNAYTCGSGSTADKHACSNGPTGVY